MNSDSDDNNKNNDKNENINIEIDMPSKNNDPFFTLISNLLKDSKPVKILNNNPNSINPNNNNKNKIVDFFCLTNDINNLNKWLNSCLDSDNDFDLDHEDDYTSSSMDNASSTNKINILNWWIEKNKKHNLPLKYSENSINIASKNGHINVLDWWLNSDLDVKYDVRAVNMASINGKIQVLNWWLENSKKNKIKFLYDEDAITLCRLKENEMLELVKWWQERKEKDNMEFKYDNGFIDYLDMMEYKTVYNYLIENKMIVDDEKIFGKRNKIMGNQREGITIMDMFGNMGMRKRVNYSQKVNISGLPEDIQNHIKEKEEELNNNMMINGKAKEYIDNLLKIPFGKYKEEKIFTFINDFIKFMNEKFNLSIINENDLVNIFNNNTNNNLIKYNELYNKYCEYRVEYIKYVDKVFEETIYGNHKTKDQIKRIIAQWLSNGIKKGIVIGVQGPPGVGKTSLIKNTLSKCIVDFINYDIENCSIELSNNNINRPFSFISLGGSTNGSTLIGHNITYHGATSGDIVKSLKEAKIMNPIILFDELDKISKTEHGHEIASVLTHITDPTQNDHFTDRYFSEVKIDLSKMIIVFTYNDSNLIDRILMDRILEIRVNPIKPYEKLEIVKKFIIPEICDNIGYNKSNIIINDDDINYIISEYTYEAGVRKLKEKCFELVRSIHFDKIKNYNNNNNNKIIINKEVIEEIFNEHHKFSLKKINKKQNAGCMNGMYATTNGLGDIMNIQVKKIYSKDILSLNTTGSLEKVISESITVAKTVAWNLLTEEEKKKVIETYNNTGLHIHMPDGSTPKDGPSAGGAITLAIYSLLVDKSIRTDVAMTGEIDLDGNITIIGGLDAKLSGAKRAGVKIALVPLENKRHIEMIKRNYEGLFDKNFKVKFISHISEAIKFLF